MAGGVDNRIVSPSITNSSGQPPQNGIDRTSTEGSHDMGYGIPNKLVDYHWTEVGIPVTYWRAVGYTQNTFFVESFMDELAAAGGKDPVELRRRLLAQNPRLLGVLELAAQKADWGKPLPAGRFRGVAVVNNVGQLHGAGGRSLGEPGQGAGASRGLRGGLRTRGEPGDRGAADPQRRLSMG